MCWNSNKSGGKGLRSERKQWIPPPPHCGVSLLIRSQITLVVLCTTLSSRHCQLSLLTNARSQSSLTSGPFAPGSNWQPDLLVAWTELAHDTATCLPWKMVAIHHSGKKFCREQSALSTLLSVSSLHMSCCYWSSNKLKTPDTVGLGALLCRTGTFSYNFFFSKNVCRCSCSIFKNNIFISVSKHTMKKYQLCYRLQSWKCYKYNQLSSAS